MSRLGRSRVEGSRFIESCNPDVVVVPCSAELYLQSIVIISGAPTPAKYGEKSKCKYASFPRKWKLDARATSKLSMKLRWKAPSPTILK